MGEPIEMDIPHKLGKAGVHERLDKGIGKIATMIPGGAMVDHRWDGDVLHFTVQAMGQRIASRLEPFDAHVHAMIDLPPFLALFADRIRAKLKKDGPKLLKQCNLPLTGERVVDMVVTDLAVFTIDKHGKDGMALIELADGVTLDEVKAKTEADFRVALKNA